MSSLSLQAFIEKWVAKYVGYYRDGSGLGLLPRYPSGPALAVIPLVTQLPFVCQFASLKITVWLSHKGDSGSREIRVRPLHFLFSQNAISLCQPWSLKTRPIPNCEERKGGL